MRKKREQHYSDDWRKQAHEQAQIVLAKVRVRDAAARIRRAEIKATQQKDNQR